MQISLNVDVYECQESLKQQQLGSNPSLSGLNFVQYSIKDLTFPYSFCFGLSCVFYNSTDVEKCHEVAVLRALQTSSL